VPTGSILDGTCGKYAESVVNEHLRNNQSP
jgi:hypothetical protein